MNINVGFVVVDHVAEGQNKSAEAVIEGFKDVHRSTFYEFKTITADNGTEFAGHQEVAAIKNTNFYFAKSYSSWP